MFVAALSVTAEGTPSVPHSSVLKILLGHALYIHTVTYTVHEDFSLLCVKAFIEP